jgi:fluoroquinolone resistance protein
MRDAQELFEDLVNLTSDDWNAKVAAELGMSVELLKIAVITKENLSNSEDRLHLDIKSNDVTELFESQKGEDVEANNSPIEDDRLYTSRSLNKYVMRINDYAPYANSIACTGKIIVGLDFRDADLADSYFCECVFFNCDFTGTQLSTVAFSGCAFNDCTLVGADFSGSVVTRCRFMESNLDNTLFEYAVITDSVMLACQLMLSNFFQAKILNSGFNDCTGNGISFKDVAFISTAFTLCVFPDSNFKRTSLIDVILVQTDFRGCSFEGASATCVTSSRTMVDDKFKYLLEMSHSLFSPGIFGWETEEGTNDAPDTDVNLDTFGGSSPYPDDDDDDIDKPWLK